jgi:hypothetical protein
MVLREIVSTFRPGTVDRGRRHQRDKFNSQRDKFSQGPVEPDQSVRGLGHGALLRIVERLLAQYAAVVEQ